MKHRFSLLTQLFLAAFLVSLLVPSMTPAVAGELSGAIEKSEVLFDDGSDDTELVAFFQNVDNLGHCRTGLKVSFPVDTCLLKAATASNHQTTGPPSI
jgi:hypothetical protein